jgi:hypothetical protein
LAFAFAFFVTVYYAKKSLDIRFDYLFIVKCLLASIVMSLLLLRLMPEGAFDLLVSVLAAALVYFMALFLLKGVSKQEIDFFRGLLKV